MKPPDSQEVIIILPHGSDRLMTVRKLRIMKKKFVPAYELLGLVKGKAAFYIKVRADSKSGERRRFRNSFNLNRIRDIPERIIRGEGLVRKIRFWLEQGNYYEDFDERLVILEMKLAKEKPQEEILLCDAIAKARDLKISETDRRGSKRSYKTHAKQFLDFLQLKKWDHLYASEFTREHARAYITHWIDQGLTNNNYFNTKLTFIKGYFIQLIEEEYIDKSPFEKIKPRRKSKAQRNTIEMNDMATLAQLAKEKNVWLWVAIQLAFWGLIRQEELSRLKFGHFDFKKWYIPLSGEETKNGKDDPITLPIFLREEFRKIGFFKWPANYYVIGKKVRPGLERIDERKLHKRFMTVLNRAHKARLIDNHKGISFSSWRRTGMNYFSRKLNPRSFKDHNRHDDFSTTERYLDNRNIILEVSNMVNDVF